MQKDGDQCLRKRWKGQVQEMEKGIKKKKEVVRVKTGKGCVQGDYI